MSDWRIREAVLDDAPFLVALNKQLGYPDTEGFIHRRIAEIAEHPDGILLVACDWSGRCGGYINLHRIPQLTLPGDFCRISYFCVDETLRGKGLGRLLEQAAVAWAREHGCQSIELHSHSRRVDAHAFYAKMGYVENPKYLCKSLPPSTELSVGSRQSAVHCFHPLVDDGQ